MKNRIQFFDNRFVILSNHKGILVSNNDHLYFVNELGDNNLMSKCYKYISCTIPNLKTLEGKLIKPYLYMMDVNKVNHDLKIKSEFDLIFIKGKI